MLFYFKEAATRRKRGKVIFKEAVTRRDTLDKKEDATIIGGAHHFDYHL